ncbi:glycosyltransferase WbuB [Bacillus timonensis]|uniref:Glycosyltransferase WbuB n=1 Tax=Bacillus timonensis TaxID=1033734 RepID=A0A4S3PP33_9BACI|nr:glycosyltransferase family 4 protein [Bacillus timonensis]THE11350.1 glycosyltransferase WbuB [Bacillus timonensis]
MKILVIDQHFYPEQFRVNDICFELAKEGHDVTVLTGLPNYPSGVVEPEYRWFKKRYEIINGVKVHRSWILERRSGTLRLALNYISFVITGSIKALFLKKDFDVVLVYQTSPVTMAIPGIVVKKLTKTPLIIYCHDLWPESIASAGISPDSKIYSILLPVSKWIYKSANGIFTSSKLFEKYFNNKLGIYENITHLPVYAEALFENIKPKSIDDGNTNLVFAGNIGEMQSVETILLAANELKNEDQIKFHIVGDGSSREKCQKLAEDLGLSNVIFHGQYPLTEMPRFYEMADAFLITLKENKVISYTLPNKVQSYMAAGKPILGAIDGETQLVINESDCGLCASAEDYKTFATLIKQFTNEKEKHETYGRNARKYYDQHFSKVNYMKRLNHLFKKIISGRDA